MDWGGIYPVLIHKCLGTQLSSADYTAAVPWTIRISVNHPGFPPSDNRSTPAISEAGLQLLYHLVSLPLQPLPPICFPPHPPQTSPPEFPRHFPPHDISAEQDRPEKEAYVYEAKMDHGFTNSSRSAGTTLHSSLNWAKSFSI